jgi:hypothetical protein
MYLRVGDGGMRLRRSICAADDVVDFQFRTRPDKVVVRRT